jgi:hypothetical protein
MNYAVPLHIEDNLGFDASSIAEGILPRIGHRAMIAFVRYAYPSVDRSSSTAIRADVLKYSLTSPSEAAAISYMLPARLQHTAIGPL